MARPGARRRLDSARYAADRVEVLRREDDLVEGGHLSAARADDRLQLVGVRREVRRRGSLRSVGRRRRGRAARACAPSGTRTRGRVAQDVHRGRIVRADVEPAGRGVGRRPAPVAAAEFAGHVDGVPRARAA